MREFILAIDQGTTSCRAIIFDKKSKPTKKLMWIKKNLYTYLLEIKCS